MTVVIRKSPLQVTSDHFRMTPLSFDNFFQFCKEIGDGKMQIELKTSSKEDLKAIQSTKSKCKSKLEFLIIYRRIW